MMRSQLVRARFSGKVLKGEKCKTNGSELTLGISKPLKHSRDPRDITGTLCYCLEGIFGCPGCWPSSSFSLVTLHRSDVL